jgi:HAD superfamily hydrolase (TIGR01662 family)
MNGKQTRPAPYALYRHAGEVPFEQWRLAGIEVPVFDKDGTITSANREHFVDEVIDGFIAQDLASIYPTIAVVSNNNDASHVQEFNERLQDEVGVKVFSVCKADGYPSKPDPSMGLRVAQEFGVEPSQLGICGDRRLVDVVFGRNVGAGAIALCRKAGKGDAAFVPLVRPLEAGIVRLDRIRKVATRSLSKIAAS